MARLEQPLPKLPSAVRLVPKLCLHPVLQLWQRHTLQKDLAVGVHLVRGRVPRLIRPDKADVLCDPREIDTRDGGRSAGARPDGARLGQAAAPCGRRHDDGRGRGRPRTASPAAHGRQRRRRAAPRAETDGEGQPLQGGPHCGLEAGAAQGLRGKLRGGVTRQAACALIVPLGERKVNGRSTGGSETVDGACHINTRGGVDDVLCRNIFDRSDV
jgi:hypothetical protein